MTKQMRALNLINSLAQQGFDLNEVSLILETVRDWGFLLTKEDISEALVNAVVQVESAVAVNKAMKLS